MTFLSAQRTPHILWPRWWQRHPWAVWGVTALALFSCLDHAGYVGWRGDDAARYQGRVFKCVRVLDGDTVDLAVPDGRYENTRLRLCGIDTPERAWGDRPSMHFAEQAASFTRRALLNRPLRVQLPPERSRDRFGRVVAYVFTEDGGRMFNAELLRSGHAFADRRFEHPALSWFVELERQARASRTGLWEGITPDLMPRWRRIIYEEERAHDPAPGAQAP